ncbi:MAG: hypothetical protein O3C40_37420 [Planctomycetota bacterium]|nr:hypothetical protein [Planctomycetota bacterium]
MEKFLKDIGDRLSPDFIINAFGQSEAGMQLVEEVAHRVEVEHSEKKRERFANLIVSSWIEDEPIAGIFDRAKLFAEANTKFTDTHMAILM